MELSTFAEAVRGFVREISQPGKVCHEELPEIHAAVKKVLPVHRAQIACLLWVFEGGIGSGGSVVCGDCESPFCECDVAER